MEQEAYSSFYSACNQKFLQEGRDKKDFDLRFLPHDSLQKPDSASFALESNGCIPKTSQPVIVINLFKLKVSYTSREILDLHRMN